LHFPAPRSILSAAAFRLSIVNLEARMSFGDFLRKQFVDVIEWTETGTGVLAYRYPMQDSEIQYGGQLTVRESQAAVFVNEGRIADVFGPGLYTLETRTLPIMTNLMNWDKAFKSPFKSDVYFFSTRLQTGQRWGTSNPITIRDKDFGMVRLRGFGMYSFRLADPALFHTSISGTKDIYEVVDLEPHLRDLIVGRFSDAFAKSAVPFLDMAANLVELAQKVAEQIRPGFGELGLKLESFVVENLSLPDELQKRLDERIGMNMVGNLNDYTKFQVAQSIPTAAANPGGAAGLGAGLGAGVAMGKAMSDAVSGSSGASSGASSGTSSGGPAAQPAGATKFCSSCGKSIGRGAKFCPECGAAQG
jgi:membrane protease subunit (stomatin/prohibitin family)